MDDKNETYLDSVRLQKGNILCSYIPITWIMWKILTSLIREEIYHRLEGHGQFPEEQKGCGKGTRRTNHLLCTDQHIIKKVKTKRKNVAMAWVEYKRLTWIIECLQMCKISEQLINSWSNCKWIILSKIKSKETSSRKTHYCYYYL